ALEALLSVDAQDDFEPDETGASPHSGAYPRSKAFSSTDAVMLHMSDQSLETEHHIERDAIGGAMSVKLVSWSEPLKITANHPDVVERNARYLGRLYHEAKVKEPPVMEWTFLANATQAYTGNKETLFSHVVCMESKQHLFWIHYLREPFSTMAGDSAVHRHTLHFGHGTNTAGVEGIMDSCYLAPATIADGAGKWQCPVMVHGFVMSLANGRHTVWESFKSRQEAITAGTLMRALRGQDPYLWDNRYAAIKELTKVTDGPVRSLEDFWTARPADAVPEDFELNEEHEGNDDLATLAGSPEFRPEDDEEAEPVDPLDTVQQFERTTQTRFLEECKLDNYKVNTINNWVSQKVGKEKMAQVRLAGSELAAAIERLRTGNRPAVDAIAVQWGLPVSAAAKLNKRSLYQLIATCYVLGQE
ncbi:unnamed protein product, partial [Symbiodinium sp. KB8]